MVGGRHAGGSRVVAVWRVGSELESSAAHGASAAPGGTVRTALFMPSGISQRCTACPRNDTGAFSMNADCGLVTSGGGADGADGAEERRRGGAGRWETGGSGGGVTRAAE